MANWWVSAALAAVTVAAAQPVVAQSYPVRAIRIIVPTAPGGGGDTVARILSQGLSDRLGRQVVIDNRTGASTMIGGEMVAKSAPDGYTLLLGVSTLAINPSAYKKVPYDALKDFAPITQAAFVPNLMIAHPSVPARNVKELIAFAKSRPGQVLFASAGHGTNPHLSVELFCTMAGIKMVHVPYKSSGPGIIDVIAGNVALMAPNMIQSIPHVRAGRLRGLGVTSAQRVPSEPDIPTIAEAGLPGYESVQWYGLLAPAGTPRDIVMRLHKESVAILQSAEARERLAADGGGPATSASPEAFGEFIRAETLKWAKVSKAAGIQPE